MLLHSVLTFASLLWLKPTIYRPQGKHANHYNINAVSIIGVVVIRSTVIWKNIINMCYGGDSQKGSLLYIILLLLDEGQRSLLQSKWNIYLNHYQKISNDLIQANLYNIRIVDALLIKVPQFWMKYMWKSLK